MVNYDIHRQLFITALESLKPNLSVTVLSRGMLIRNINDSGKF